MLGSPPADHDSELVARFRRAGLIVVGKTTTPEFGASATTEVDLTGITRNPWSLDHTSGGSSGGAAVSVACGIVPAAQGGDGGGSLRIPAACCHLFTVKATRQRYPTGPDGGDQFYGFSVPGVLTTTVRDGAALMDAGCGPDVGTPYWAPPRARPYLEEAATNPAPLRIAVAVGSFAGEEVHPDCAAAVQAAAKLCEHLGHQVTIDQPIYDREAFLDALTDHLFGGIAFAVDAIGRELDREPSPENLERLTWMLVQDGRKRTAVEFIRSGQYLGALGREIGRFFERYDVLLTPSLAAPPVPLGYLKNDTDVVADYLRKATAWLPFQPLFNGTGQPAANIPFDVNADGLPIGVQIAARFGDEATLFQLAGQIERARPWRHRKPQNHVGA
jgi:Asp-tRNA(Asn)/Glu-tRNA(Gln) amidotransferase A subunit family amidase